MRKISPTGWELKPRAPAPVSNGLAIKIAPDAEAPRTGFQVASKSGLIPKTQGSMTPHFFLLFSLTLKKFQRIPYHVFVC